MAQTANVPPGGTLRVWRSELRLARRARVGQVGGICYEEVSNRLSKEDRAWLFDRAGRRLRAIGRLRDSIDAFAAATRSATTEEQKAASFTNLGKIELSLGRTADAKNNLQKGVVHARKSRVPERIIYDQTAQAEALLWTGDIMSAEHRFFEADLLVDSRIFQQKEYYALHGYRFADFLLVRGKAEVVLSRYNIYKQGARLDDEDRTSLLDRALAELAAGLAAGACGRGEEEQHLQEAVSRMRNAARVDQLPRSLLARAACLRRKGDIYLAGNGQNVDRAARRALPSSIVKDLDDLKDYLAGPRSIRITLITSRSG